MRLQLYIIGIYINKEQQCVFDIRGMFPCFLCVFIW